MPYNSSLAYITPTLSHGSYRVARELGIVTEGVATGGATGTLVDANDLTQADDYWNGGSVWILRDSAEAAAAPEAEMAVVSDFANSSGTATCRNFAAGTGNAFTVAPAAGDRYAIGKKRYSLHLITQKINEALIDMGPIEYTDKTSLDTATNQTELTIPIAANMDLREVYVQGRTGDADDNKWIQVRMSDIERTTTGSSDLLVLPFQYVGSRDVKLVYAQEHPPLDDPSDQIREDVHLDLLVPEAIVRCLMWRKQKVGSGDPTLNEQLNFYLQVGADGTSRLESARMKYGIKLPPKPANLLILGKAVQRDRFTYPGPP